MQRPTFFLSSTIYDFRDLRSALKYFLEKQGCRVLASEYNDFTKPLDEHSYQACLTAIEQANYFVLLIGSRVGGWYDKADRVSITQKEYRTAYELQKKGNLRLLSFVRSDVWDFKENIKSLGRHLADLSELDAETKARVTAYPSRFATDARFIVSFIEEVARNKETSAAVAGKGTLPVGNWLHVFTGFTDVIDAVEPLIFNGASVAQAAASKALQMQLLLLLQGSLAKVGDRVVSPRNAVSTIATAIKLKAEDASTTTTVPDSDWNRLVTLVVLASGAEARPEIFESFLGSPLLLQYAPTTSSFHPTAAYDALARLIEQIRRFNSAKAMFDFREMVVHGKTRTSQGVRLPTILVARALSLLLRWVDLMDIAKAIAQGLDGQPLRIPEPMPRSPFADEEQRLSEEQVTMDEVRHYLGLVDRSGGKAEPTSIASS